MTQQFASKGATFPPPANGQAVPPLLADADQLKIRYDASTNRYEVQLPGSVTWSALLPGGDSAWAGGGTSVSVVQSGASASLIRWSSSDGMRGATALAIPTPASAIPVTGSGHYAGTLAGFSTERISFPRGAEPIRSFVGSIGGTIDLTFNFGTGSLSGEINPTLFALFTRFNLPTLTFTDTVHAVGSTSFSGKFDTNVPGLNSFSGIFAGPSAGNVAGNFAFPYLSPLNGSNQQAAGAFTGQKTP